MSTVAHETMDLAQLRGLERPLKVWGMTAAQLHDRFWASLGVQVVRRRVGRVDPAGPSLFLLLDEDDLVLFPIAPVVKRINWVKPAAVRVRLVDKTADAYVESVVCDDKGRFSAVRREYLPRTNATLRVTVTTEAKLAAVWVTASSGLDAYRAIRHVAGRDRISAASGEARVFHAGDRAEEIDFIDELLKRWRDPGHSIDGLYEYQDRIWAHENSTISPRARLVAPAWIGANATLADGQAVIGPDVVPDGPGAVPAVGAFDWNSSYFPGWRPVPRLRRRRLRRMSKRAFDVCFSAAVLACTLPLYPLVMAAIYVEDGRPFFFAHRRQTAMGREFPCLKFRTMRRDADQMKEQLKKANQADGPQFYIDDDPRVLKVGRIFRRFQIDELPQFINVLLGHMSVVGPRPSPDKENQFCPAWREARLSVRPGVTGLWQVRRTRAPETDFQEWIRYDLEYVQHESWKLDLWIIWQTIAKVVSG